MKKMRIACVLAGLAGFVFPSAQAASHDAHAGHGTLSAPAESALVDGVVKKIDKAGGKVTVAHGPLTHLNMSRPMTMVFRVKDASWLNRMRVDGRIRFVADYSTDGTLVIVRFETAE